MYPSPLRFNTMDSHTSSNDRTTASGHCQLPYTCQYCFKSFESGQAFGGHQTAHREEIRFNNGIVESQNLPIAPVQEELTIEPGLYQQGPVVSTDVIGDGVLQSATKGPFVEGMPYENPTGSKEIVTKDLFREWVLPIYAIGRGEGGEGSNVHGIVFDPVARVSEGDEQADETNSEKKEDLDLDLKLGM